MIKITDIEALFGLVKNGSVTLNDISSHNIYEVARYFRTEVRVLNNITETVIKKDLVTITINDIPF